MCHSSPLPELQTQVQLPTVRTHRMDPQVPQTPRVETERIFLPGAALPPVLVSGTTKLGTDSHP